ncbi:hypothetical protein ACHAQJ_007489 [Trichoderma viride]
MASLFSRLLSGSPTNVSSSDFVTISQVNNFTNPSPQTLCILPSTANPGLTVVQFESAPPNALPLYSIASHFMSPGMFIVYHGLPDPTGQVGPIGHFTCNSESSVDELNMRGWAMKFNMSQLTGDFSVAGTPMGTLKWKANQLTGSSTLTLYDSHGKKLAKTKTKASGLGEQKIEMLVPYNEMVVELAVMSAYQTKAVTERVTSTAMEVIQAISGN